MTPLRLLLGAVTVVTALVLQTTVVARLPLPGDPPDLVLLVVVALALAEGPLSGVVTGFVAGACADLLADHQVGRLALAYLLAGWLAGLGEGERSAWRPFVSAGAGAAVALLVYAAEGLLLGDARVTGDALLGALASSVPYAVVLVPFVVPLVAVLCRRVDPDPERRLVPARRARR